MEGVGSRLGRASSRYGPAPVFSGPVRKWKRQWVHVSSSLSSTLSHQHTTSSHSNANNPSTLLLCRWTPIPSNNSTDSDQISVEPPKRKFRYTPIVVLEEKKKEVPAKVEDERSGSKTNEYKAREISETNDIFDKTDIDNLFNEDPQGSNGSEAEEEHAKGSQMDLDLRLKGHDDNKAGDSDDETEEAE